MKKLIVCLFAFAFIFSGAASVSQVSAAENPPVGHPILPPM